MSQFFKKDSRNKKINEIESEYYFYYIRTNVMVKCSKRAFISSDAKVVNLGDKKVKVIGYVFNPKKKISSFFPEGLLSDCSSALEGAKVIFELLQTIGSFKNKLDNISSRLIIDFIKLLTELYTYFNNPRQGCLDLVNLLFSFYLLSTNDIFKAESLDAYLLAGVSMFLPNKLFTLLQRAQVLTSAKLVDDVGSLHAILQVGIDFIFGVLDLIHAPDYVIGFVKEVVSFFQIGKHHHMVSMMRQYNDLLDKDKKKYLDPLLLVKLQELEASVKASVDIAEWIRRSAGVKLVYDQFLRNVKIAHSNCSPMREEPVCMIFEGPPGCGKSITMTMLIQTLGESNYSHEIKPTTDGKDFYDSYNNEFVFYVDDWGQQGNSQYRVLIPMVSPVKLPLPCAEASLKDTKFFNSKLILATTNNFRNINLMRDDGIADIKALWRRVLLINKDNCIYDNERKWFSGKVGVQFFDLQTNRFENGFPPYISKVIKDKQIPIHHEFVFRENNLKNYLAWLNDIARISLHAKQIGCKTFTLTPEYIDDVRENMLFKGEGWFSLFPEPTKDINLRSRLNDEFPDLVNRQYPDDIEDDIARLDNQIFFEQLEEPRLALPASYHVLPKSDMGWWIGLVKDKMSSLLYKLAGVVADVITVYNNNKDTFHSIFLVSGVLVAYGIFMGLFTYTVSAVLPKQQSWVAEINDLSLKYLKEPHSSITATSKSVKFIEIIGDKGVTSYSVGLLSGHCILVTNHSVPNGDLYVNVYNDWDKKHRIIDHMKVEILLQEDQDDVIILALPRNFPTPFPNLSHFFKEEISGRMNSFLVTPRVTVALDNIDATKHSCSAVYRQTLGDKEFVNKFKKDDFFYFLRGYGLCGSLVMGQDIGIVGFHVAGNEQLGVGVSLKWSDSVRRKIKEILAADINFVGVPFSSKVIPESSVLKLDKKMHISVPKESNFRPTPLYGVFPLSRQPSNLTVDGPCTVKTIAKKSFGLCSTVDQSEIAFGKQVLRSMLGAYGTLTENEIVKGNEFLAGLNKDSSNGYQCKKLKSDYIDFEAGCYKDDFRIELEKIEEDIKAGRIDNDKFLWYETLKDEIRNVEKEGVPRSFRVSTIYCQVLTKKYFGKMVEHIISNRKFNKVMIGCNPYIEWDDIYRELLSCDVVFDGDIARWDGSMVSMVQQAVSEVLLEYCEGDKRIASFILQNLNTTPVAVMDDLYLTTHSMPSGSFLTAIFNSLVNRFYTAMWFKRFHGENLGQFWDCVVDYVYGDDKLVGIRRLENLNALTMRDFFVSIGLDMTTSDKRYITSPVTPLSDISFLKRAFRFHHKLKRVMCPLDLRTLYSGLSWYDGSKSLDVVMRDKLACFQREIYLHPNWELLRNDFVNKLRENDIDCVILPESYLISVFDDDKSYELSWGSRKYL